MKAIQTDSAPQAIGPYSQAIVAGNFVFCSGQIPLEPEFGAIIVGDVRIQTQRVIDNLRAVLQAAGVDLDQVVKTEVYLARMEDFAEMNEVYSANFIMEPYPARATIEVARLPKDVLVEIACIAQLK